MNTFEKIYQIVSKIPKGKVLTYKNVAELAGITNARVVGFAMRANKDTVKIPCHRVVGSDGKLKGYAFGGVKEKKDMLLKEGVTFLNETAIDLKKHLYKGI